MNEDPSYSLRSDRETLGLLRDVAQADWEACCVQGGKLEQVSPGLYRCSGLLIRKGDAIWIAFEAVDIEECGEAFKLTASVLSEAAMKAPTWRPLLESVATFPNGCALNRFFRGPRTVEVLSEVIAPTELEAPSSATVDAGLLVRNSDGLCLVFVHDTRQPLQAVLSTDHLVVESQLARFSTRPL
jgi:hypothetical protein